MRRVRTPDRESAESKAERRAHRSAVSTASRVRAGVLGLLASAVVAAPRLWEESFGWTDFGQRVAIEPWNELEAQVGFFMTLAIRLTCMAPLLLLPYMWIRGARSDPAPRRSADPGFVRRHLSTLQVKCFLGMIVVAALGQGYFGRENVVGYWIVTGAFVVTALWAIWTNWGWDDKPWSIFALSAYMTVAQIVAVSEVTSGFPRTGPGFWLSTGLAAAMLGRCWTELFGTPAWLRGATRQGARRPSASSAAR